MPFTVKLLQNDWAQKAADMERGIIDAVDETALAIESKAKIKVKKKSGNLSRSIHVEKDGEYRRIIGTDAEYAARQEMGFTGADSLGRVYKQAAQPYLRPAAEEESAAFQDRIRQALG